MRKWRRRQGAAFYVRSAESKNAGAEIEGAAEDFARIAAIAHDLDTGKSASRFTCDRCQVSYEAGLRLAQMSPEDPRWWGLWNQFVMALEGTLQPSMVRPINTQQNVDIVAMELARVLDSVPLDPAVVDEWWSDQSDPDSAPNIINWVAGRIVSALANPPEA